MTYPTLLALRLSHLIVYVNAPGTRNGPRSKAEWSRDVMAQQSRLDEDGPSDWVVAVHRVHHLELGTSLGKLRKTWYCLRVRYRLNA